MKYLGYVYFVGRLIVTALLVFAVYKETGHAVAVSISFLIIFAEIMSWLFTDEIKRKMSAKVASIVRKLDK